MDIFVVKYTGRGLVVKRSGSKVQLLSLVLRVGVFSLLPIIGFTKAQFSPFTVCDEQGV